MRKSDGPIMGLICIILAILCLFGTLIHYSRLSIARAINCNTQPDTTINFSGSFVFDKQEPLTDLESAIICKSVEKKIEELINVK